MSENLSDPRFWLALALSLAASAVFVYWLFTGGRRRGDGPKNPPTSRSGL